MLRLSKNLILLGLVVSFVLVLNSNCLAIDAFNRDLWTAMPVTGDFNKMAQSEGEVTISIEGTTVGEEATITLEADDEEIAYLSENFGGIAIFDPRGKPVGNILIKSGKKEYSYTWLKAGEYTVKLYAGFYWDWEDDSIVATTVTVEESVAEKVTPTDQESEKEFPPLKFEVEINDRDVVVTWDEYKKWDEEAKEFEYYATFFDISVYKIESDGNETTIVKGGKGKVSESGLPSRIKHPVTHGGEYKYELKDLDIGEYRIEIRAVGLDEKISDFYEIRTDEKTFEIGPVSVEPAATPVPTSVPDEITITEALENIEIEIEGTHRVGETITILIEGNEEYIDEFIYDAMPSINIAPLNREESVYESEHVEKHVGGVKDEAEIIKSGDEDDLKYVWFGAEIAINSSTELPCGFEWKEAGEYELSLLYLDIDEGTGKKVIKVKNLGTFEVEFATSEETSGGEGEITIDVDGLVLGEEATITLGGNVALIKNMADPEVDGHIIVRYPNGIETQPIFIKDFTMNDDGTVTFEYTWPIDAGAGEYKIFVFSEFFTERTIADLAVEVKESSADAQGAADEITYADARDNIEINIEGTHKVGETIIFSLEGEEEYKDKFTSVESIASINIVPISNENSMYNGYSTRRDDIGDLERLKKIHSGDELTSGERKSFLDTAEIGPFSYLSDRGTIEFPCELVWEEAGDFEIILAYYGGDGIGGIVESLGTVTVEPAVLEEAPVTGREVILGIDGTVVGEEATITLKCNNEKFDEMVEESGFMYITQPGGSVDYENPIEISHGIKIEGEEGEYYQYNYTWPDSAGPGKYTVSVFPSQFEQVPIATMTFTVGTGTVGSVSIEKDVVNVDAESELIVEADVGMDIDELDTGTIKITNSEGNEVGSIDLEADEYKHEWTEAGEYTVQITGEKDGDIYTSNPISVTVQDVEEIEVTTGEDKLPATPTDVPIINEKTVDRVVVTCDEIDGVDDYEFKIIDEEGSEDIQVVGTNSIQILAESLENVELVAGEEYTVQVRGVNEQGKGEWGPATEPFTIEEEVEFVFTGSLDVKKEAIAGEEVVIKVGGNVDELDSGVIEIITTDEAGEEVKVDDIRLEKVTERLPSEGLVGEKETYEYFVKEYHYTFEEAGEYTLQIAGKKEGEEYTSTSYSITVTAEGDKFPVAPEEAPTVGKRTEDEVKVSWEEFENATGYKINIIQVTDPGINDGDELEELTEATGVSLENSPIENIDGDIRTYSLPQEVLDEMEAGQKYAIQVCGVNEAGETAGKYKVFTLEEVVEEEVEETGSVIEIGKDKEIEVVVGDVSRIILGDDVVGQLDTEKGAYLKIKNVDTQDVEDKELETEEIDLPLDDEGVSVTVFVTEYEQTWDEAGTYEVWIEGENEEGEIIKSDPVAVTVKSEVTMDGVSAFTVDATEIEVGDSSTFTVGNIDELNTDESSIQISKDNTVVANIALEVDKNEYSYEWVEDDEGNSYEAGEYTVQVVGKIVEAEGTRDYESDIINVTLEKKPKAEVTEVLTEDMKEQIAYDSLLGYGELIEYIIEHNPDNVTEGEQTDLDKLKDPSNVFEGAPEVDEKSLIDDNSQIVKIEIALEDIPEELEDLKYYFSLYGWESATFTYVFDENDRTLYTGVEGDTEDDYSIHAWYSEYRKAAEGGPADLAGNNARIKYEIATYTQSAVVEGDEEKTVREVYITNEEISDGSKYSVVSAKQYRDDELVYKGKKEGNTTTEEFIEPVTNVMGVEIDIQITEFEDTKNYSMKQYLREDPDPVLEIEVTDGEMTVVSAKKVDPETGGLIDATEEATDIIIGAAIDAPTAVVVAVEDIDTDGKENDAVVSWDAVDGAVEYDVDVLKDGMKDDELSQEGVIDTEITLKDLEDGDYEVRVAAVDNEGNISDYTSYQFSIGVEAVEELQPPEWGEPPVRVNEDNNTLTLNYKKEEGVEYVESITQNPLNPYSWEEYNGEILAPGEYYAVKVEAIKDGETVENNYHEFTMPAEGAKPPVEGAEPPVEGAKSPVEGVAAESPKSPESSVVIPDYVPGIVEWKRAYVREHRGQEPVNIEVEYLSFAAQVVAGYGGFNEFYQDVIRAGYIGFMGIEEWAIKKIENIKAGAESLPEGKLGKYLDNFNNFLESEISIEVPSDENYAISEFASWKKAYQDEHPMEEDSTEVEFLREFVFHKMKEMGSEYRWNDYFDDLHENRFGPGKMSDQLLRFKTIYDDWAMLLDLSTFDEIPLETLIR